MGLFRRKDKVIDLSERYNLNHQRATKMKAGLNDEQKDTPDNFLSSMAGAGSVVAEASDDEFSGNSEDKRKRLVKRLIDMTSRIEDMSNQIYRLQQRIDLLERKLKVRGEE